MKLITRLGICLLIIIFNQHIFAQGPPITGDKPIMLGAKRIVLKTLSEYRIDDHRHVLSTPMMIHYLPSSSTLIGLHVPWIKSSLDDENQDVSSLGDIQLLAKYQFWRKDEMGKTLRFVAKALQTFGTGEALAYDGISTGFHQSYLSFVIGYETIKYGISHEIGYNQVFDNARSELRHKLGFGLPLKKPSYPVDQVNLYFEYQSSWFPEIDEYMLFYAQGIQYAKNRITLELALQFPLIQQIGIRDERQFSLFIGSRFVI